jgi:galactonate dehydratase
MKITAVKTYIIPSEISATDWGGGETWVLVKLETDEGIEGWGETHRFHEREYAIAAEVHRLSDSLIGMDPFCIKRFVTKVSDSITDPRDGIEVSTAAAGIEIALWDIVGKALGVPVYKLLGGACRDRIKVYANCWSDEIRSAEQLATFAAKQVERGFKAVKIYPFLYDSTAEEGIERLAAVRDAVGHDTDVFVDMWSQLSQKDLPLIVEALHAHGVSWFEDPADATDVDALARIRAQSKLPIVSGETLFSKQDFRRLLENKAADILNPEITVCGILGTKEIAAIAEAYSTNVSVHNDNTMTIGLAAAMQAAAVCPNFTVVEFFPRLEKASNTFSSFPFELDEDGCIPLSPEPGLGVTVDEEALTTMKFDPVSGGQ